MNQLYAEAGCKRKETMSTMGLRSLLILGIVVGVMFMLFGGGGILGIVGVVLVIGLVYMFPKLNVEYEYVFVDGQLDFDRITGKSKRKTVLRIDMEQIEIIAPKNSHSLDGFTHIKCELKDFSSGNKDSKPYIIIASADNKKLQISFEPSEKMLTMMKQKSPRKIAQF